MSKYEVFSGPYFPVFGTEYGKIQTRKNSLFGHFSHSKYENNDSADVVLTF